MTSYKVRVFELPRALQDRPGHAPLKEKPGFAVDAEDIDAARVACGERLKGWGYEVRSISCLVPEKSDGAKLSAIVYEKQASTAPAPR